MRSASVTIPRGAPVLVHHHRQVPPGAPHVLEEVVRPPPLGDRQHGPERSARRSNGGAAG